VRREEHHAAVAEWCGERVVLGPANLPPPNRTARSG
jgi:hypothetical protein